MVRRLRPGADAQLLQLPLQPDRLRRAAQAPRRGGGGGLRPLGDRGQPAVPGALGRRLRGDLRVDGRVPAGRVVVGPVRLRLLEPRHRRLRGHPDTGAVQALAGLRTSLLPQPPARQLLLPGAVAVRRGVRGRAAALHPPQAEAHAVPLRGRAHRPRRGRAGDAGDGPGVPGRSRVRASGAAVHARPGPDGGAGVQRRGRGLLLRPRGHLDPLRDRRDGHRAALGAREARLPERSAAGQAWRGGPGRRGGRPTRLRPRRRGDPAGLRPRAGRAGHAAGRRGRLHRRTRGRHPAGVLLRPLGALGAGRGRPGARARAGTGFLSLELG